VTWTRNVMAREKALYEGHAVAAVNAIVARIYGEGDMTLNFDTLSLAY
jgi:hypothetical protein